MKIWLKILISIIVTAGIVGIVWYYTNKQSNSRQSDLQAQTDSLQQALDIWTMAQSYASTQSDLTTWKTYTSSDKTISFKYPANLYIQANENCWETGEKSAGVFFADFKPDICSIEAASSQAFFTLSVSKLSGQDLQDAKNFSNNQIQENPTDTQRGGQVTITGKVWDKLIRKYDPQSGMDVNMNYTSLSSFDDNTEYQLWWPNLDDQGHYPPLVDQALGTLKLSN